MNKAIQGVIDIVIKVIDSVPILKRYRTVILVASIGSLALMDHLKVGPGGLYGAFSPYLWPLAVATGLAHSSPALTPSQELPAQAVPGPKLQ